MSAGRWRLSAVTSPEVGTAERCEFGSIGASGVVSAAAAAAMESVGSFALGNGGAACATTGAKVSATTEKTKMVDSNGRTNIDACASRGRIALMFMVFFLSHTIAFYAEFRCLVIENDVIENDVIENDVIENDCLLSRVLVVRHFVWKRLSTMKSDHEGGILALWLNGAGTFHFGNARETHPNLVSFAGPIQSKEGGKRYTRE
jgi:hypothetical protein